MNTVYSQCFAFKCNKKKFKQSGLKNLPEESAGMWEKPKTGIQIKDISFYTDTSFLILLLPIQLASIKSL